MLPGARLYDRPHNVTRLLLSGPVLITTLDVPLQAPLPPGRATPLRRFVDRGRSTVARIRTGIQFPRHAAQPALPRLSIVALHETSSVANFAKPYWPSPWIPPVMYRV